MSEYNIQMNKYNALNTEYDQLYPQPMKHANTHAKDGSDPITSADIGAYSKIETDSLLSSKPNPNLLDNWYFGNPINQRGQTSYTGEAYGIDRWTLGLWNHVSPSLLISDGYITLSNNTAEGTSSSCYIRQYIDNPEQFAGQTVTFSVLLGAVAKGSGKLVIAISVNGSAGSATEIKAENANSIASITLTLPSEVTSLSVYIGQSANNAGKGTFSIQLKAAKLELGSTQTIAHQENGVWVLNEIPDYGEQLRRCQRYFYRFPQIGDIYTDFGIGLVQSATNFYSVIKFPVSMRNAPSLVAYGSFRLLSANFNTAISVTSIEYDTGIDSSTSDSIKIRATVSGGLTVGTPMYLQAAKDPSAHIDFIADL